MALFRVLNYGRTRYVVHWAKAGNEELAKRLPAEDVNPEDWWHWRTLCGRDLIGRNVGEDYPVDCTTCLRSADRIAREIARLF